MVRTGGIGAQFQSGASGVCKTGVDENSFVGGLHEAGSKLSYHRDWRPFMTNKKLNLETFEFI
jgi:hypothetical protein